MTHQTTTSHIASTRTVSHKLLRKVAARTAAPVRGESIEDAFPGALTRSDEVGGLLELPQAAAAASAPATGQATAAASEPTPVASLVSEHVAQPALVARWSDYDEAMFQRLTVQRKAAGYKGRGGGVSSQSIRVGSITPNTGTVVAVIAGLVAERGTVVRAELVTMMGAASFPHPKARPCDPGWCQGYIAGALRNGFLALADQPAAVDSVAV